MQDCKLLSLFTEEENLSVKNPQIFMCELQVA